MPITDGKQDTIVNDGHDAGPAHDIILASHIFWFSSELHPPFVIGDERLEPHQWNSGQLRDNSIAAANKFAPKGDLKSLLHFNRTAV